MKELAVTPQPQTIEVGYTEPQIDAKMAFSRIWDRDWDAGTASLLQEWATAREAWMKRVTRKSGSAHTDRCYRRGLDQWWAFIQADPWLLNDERNLPYAEHLKEHGIGPDLYKAPWEVTDDDVARFISYLEAEHQAWPWEIGYPLPKPGLSPSSIALVLAACSSFYTQVCNTKHLVRGVEIPLFADRDGRPRSNPFKGINVQRPAVNPYEKSFPLAFEQATALWNAIDGPTWQDARTRAEQMLPAQGKALINARDRALLRLALYTGRRAQELANLRWGDIEPGNAAGTYILRWTGKGKKSGVQPLPDQCYWEIMAWLKAAGRWPAAGDDYVFRAIWLGGCENFSACRGKKLDGNRPISTDQINKIVKKLAKRAGMDPKLVHTHTLRHTFASLFLDMNGNVNDLQKMLGHSNLTVTTIYANRPARQKPIDTYSVPFQHVLGF